MSKTIKEITLRKAHDRITRKINKFLNTPTETYNKGQLNELLKAIEDLGFVKGLGMAFFDSTPNIIKKIEELEQS